MKTKLLLMMGLALIGWRSEAQNAIPNGKFENWNTASYNQPQYYSNTSNPDAFIHNIAFNCVKSTDSYHGSFALKLMTEAYGDTASFGYIVNSNPNGDPATWHGGVPYDKMPSGIKGYYKSDVPAGDSAMIAIVFSKGGAGVGLYVFKLYGTHTDYTPFSFTFDPPLMDSPDSVIFAAASSDVFDNIVMPGSMLMLDSISFTGTDTQPDMLNGDFENWDSIAISQPTDWYIASYGLQGVTQTQDAYDGNFAVDLTTYLSNHDGRPIAQPGYISTGYYDPNCQNNCMQKGGQPYSEQSDTLAFWYKYSPSGMDTAQVMLNFKKDGASIWGMSVNLLAASDYTYKEIPFNTSQMPDTVIVSFQSSAWQDTLTSYVGSNLKVDRVFFKSQPFATGIFNRVDNHNIVVYPNPGNGIFRIKTDIKATDVVIMNALGQKVYSAMLNSSENRIDLSSQPQGVYFYQILNDRKILAAGKLVIRQK